MSTTSSCHNLQLNVKLWQEGGDNMEKKEKKNYVEAYNTIILIISTVVLLGGIAIGTVVQGVESNSINFLVVIIAWISGGVFILILNILKDILNELRILNSKK